MAANYRVIVAGTESGFDPDTVLVSLSRLFRKDPEELRARFGGAFVARTFKDQEAAARLQRVLTVAGCRCEIEKVRDSSQRVSTLLLDVVAALKHAALALTHKTTPWLAAVEHRLSSWRSTFSTPGAGQALPRIAAPASAAHALAWLRRSAATRSRALWNAVQANRSERGLRHIVAIVGAAAILSLLSELMPEYTALRAAGPGTHLNAAFASIPAAPADPEFFLKAANSEDRPPIGLDPISASPRAANTALGTVNVLRDETGITPYWQLRWNGITLRDLRSDTPPALIPQRLPGTRQVLATHVGNETVVVVDSGERAAMCPASKVLLVVLAAGERPRTRELPNQCVELESVAQAGTRLLFRFYDQPKPTLAFENSRFVKLVP